MTTSVSYIWMRKYRDEPHTIPTHLFCRVQENARRYPDTPFDLWTESPEASEPYAIPPNVTLHSLNSIPAFSQLPVLSSPSAESIWAKVDIARLLVLQHELRHMKRGIAVYSDMDAPDILIKSAPFHERIKNYGIVVGGTMFEGGALANPAENGYFAFTASRAQLLDLLVHSVVEDTKSAQKFSRSIIYYKTMDFLDRQSNMLGLLKVRNPFPSKWHSKIGSFAVLPRCGYTDNQYLIAEPARPKESAEVSEAFVAIA